MKKFVSLLLLALGVAASARAGVVVGAAAGYLLDSEEAYLTARLGYEFQPGGTQSHQLEVEYGYAKHKESGDSISIAPVTANYRLNLAAGEKFSYHVGAGAGITQVQWDVGSYHGDSQPFTAQAFVGADYKFTPAASVYVDAKYLWIDDVKVFGSSVEMGDDVALSAGFSFRF